LIRGETFLPHVILNGKVAVEDIFKQLKPLFIREENNILKTTDVYLEHGKSAILIDSLAIEADKKTIFFAMITSRDNGVAVRLYPKIEVEKTEGVKRILVELAKQLLQTFPEFKVGETNLGDYLK
jgi:hypothetical protein